MVKREELKNQLLNCDKSFNVNGQDHVDML